jgi:hypothetical protein
MKRKGFNSFTFLYCAIFLVFQCSFQSCSKYRAPNAELENTGRPETGAVKGINSLLAAQPLPKGKKNFSVTLGNMDSTPWVRLGNWTFNDANGTVAATFWSWSYSDKHDVEILGSHTCTFDGVTKTVSNYTPYGWMQPAGIYASWGGNYTYNTTTGRLVISWTSGPGAGHAESWDVSLPEPGLARVKFVPASSTYNVTHGRGYGSNAAWSTFKTISDVPALAVTSITGRAIRVSYNDGPPAVTTITPATANAWSGAAWGLTDFTTPSNPNPKNTKHAWKSSTACTGACATAREGIIYHMSSNNSGRQMAWINFCACLSQNGSTANNWPGYNGNMHPSALLQIIDDSGAMRGVVGTESQNPPSTGPQSGGFPRFQMQLWDFTTIPGS